MDHVLFFLLGHGASYLYMPMQMTPSTRTISSFVPEIHLSCLIYNFHKLQNIIEAPTGEELINQDQLSHITYSIKILCLKIPTIVANSMAKGLSLCK